MLAFDIETMGLDPRRSAVTCVCVEDFHSGQKWAFEFAKVRHESPEQLQALEVELWKLLEAAPSLCAFNGIRFDTPFLGVALGLDAATMRRWNRKTTDILERCREVHRHTFSLNKLCEANGIAVKTGDGLLAIQLALERKWDELREYCEHDVHILCELYRKRHLTNPRNGKLMDLAAWTEPYVYGAQEAEPAKTRVEAEAQKPAEPAEPAEPTPANPANPATPVRAKPNQTGANSFASWMTAVATRLDRLPYAAVAESDVFGFESVFCVARCPTCDTEGFIQEDTQCLRAEPTAVYACGMQHAYRIRVA